MRFDLIRVVFLKELRETLRDRRALAIMFGIPLLLYPLLTLGAAGLTGSTAERLTERPSPVAVVDGEHAPGLLSLLEASTSGIHVIPAEDPRSALGDGVVDLVLLIPENAERRLLAGEAAPIQVLTDGSRPATMFARNKLSQVLDRYERSIISQRLRAAQVDEGLIQPVEVEYQDTARPDLRLGAHLGMILPVMLLMTGVLGLFFPATNATTLERELGTLEALLVTPASKLELLMGKTALVLLAGMLTVAINLLSMSLVVWRIASLAGGSTMDLSLNPLALLLTYVACIPTIVFFAGMLLIVGLISRNLREVNAYSTAVMLLPLIPMLVSILEPETTPGLLATPIVNTSLIIRDVLRGHASTGAFLIAFGSSAVYAGLMLSAAARVFSTEQLVNPAWEPLSLRGGGLGRGLRRRLPAIDEAVALCAVSLLLTLYLSPEWMRFGFLGMLAGTQLFLILAPALLFAWWGRYDWAPTFSWRRPSGRHLLAGLLLGVGVTPWVDVLVSMQARLVPPSVETTRATLQLLLPPLLENPIVTALAVGALAGVCEEMLFRGPVLAAARRRMAPLAALSFSALFFALAHLDLWGTPLRFLLGLLLGWLVLRTGSIFPAMLLHGVYDAVKLGTVALAAQRHGPDGLMAMAGQPAAAQALWPTHWVIAGLVVGAVLALAGWNLLRSERPAATSPQDARASKSRR
jgi:sodium transport system permease protein